MRLLALRKVSRCGILADALVAQGHTRAMPQQQATRASKGAMAGCQSRKPRPTAEIPPLEAEATLAAKVSLCPHSGFNQCCPSIIGNSTLLDLNGMVQQSLQAWSSEEVVQTASALLLSMMSGTVARQTVGQAVRSTQPPLNLMLCGRICMYF